MDHAGHEEWRRNGVLARGAWSDGRFLAEAASQGSLHVFNESGDCQSTWHATGRIAATVPRGVRVAVAVEAERVGVLDQDLRPLAAFTWPGKDGPSLHCLVNDHFYWIEANVIWRCDLAGGVELFTEIPLRAVTQAMDDYEAATGQPALQGWTVALPPGEADFAPYLLGQKGQPRVFALGERPSRYEWWLTHDADGGVFFLSNMLMPHVVLCLSEDGALRWSRYVDPACCGDTCRRLPGGLLVGKRPKKCVLARAALIG